MSSTCYLADWHGFFRTELEINDDTVKINIMPCSLFPYGKTFIVETIVDALEMIQSLSDDYADEVANQLMEEVNNNGES